MPDDDNVGTPFTLNLDADVEIRDAAKREIDMRLMPYDFPIDTLQGREQFARGAVDDIDPSRVLLMGLEHEAHIGLGQNGQPVLTRRPVGKGYAIRSDNVGPILSARVAKTAAGDELLALAEDKIVGGVSVEFTEVPGGTTTSRVGNRRVRTHHRVNLTGVSLTYRPAYGEQAAVLAVRSQPEQETTPVSEPVAAAEPAAAPVDFAPLTAAIESLGENLTRAQEAKSDELKAELDAVKEQMRTIVEVPAPAPEPVEMPAPHLWLQRAAYIQTRERMPEDLAAHFRALDDVTVADNEALFPSQLLPGFLGIIDKRRPFLSSTTRIDAPASGTSLQLPRITQHTEVGVQSTEKSQVASRPLTTTPETVDMVTIAGGVDVSIQFIKRGSAAANQLLLDDMEGQYAAVSELQAVSALLDESAVVEGGTLDPEDLELGAAFSNAYSAMSQGPDTIWVGTAALAEFIDAKASTTNAPLYNSLAADINAAGGVSGTISGLRVVHVPQLTEVDAIVGPSRGFAWAEDGTFRLEVDNPTLAGRDIAIVGFMWFHARYPAAFTSYTVGS